MEKRAKILSSIFLVIVLVSTFLTYKKYIVEQNFEFAEDEALFQQSLLEIEE